MLEFLKLGPDLGKLLTKGMEFYGMALDLGKREDATVEAVATFIERASGAWNPVVSGQTFLDDPGTRKAGARFLAGIAVRVVDGKRMSHGASRRAGL